MDSNSQAKTYPDVGELAFGLHGRIIVSLFMYLELYLVAVELMILEGDNLDKLFPSKNFHIGRLHIKGKQEMLRKGVEEGRWTEKFISRIRFKGDLVTSSPDVFQLELGSHVEFVLLASDGLWDYIKRLQIFQVTIYGDIFHQVLPKTFTSEDYISKAFLLHHRKTTNSSIKFFQKLSHRKTTYQRHSYCTELVCFLLQWALGLSYYLYFYEGQDQVLQSLISFFCGMHFKLWSNGSN